MLNQKMEQSIQIFSSLFFLLQLKFHRNKSIFLAHLHVFKATNQTNVLFNFLLNVIIFTFHSHGICCLILQLILMRDDDLFINFIF